MLAIDRDPVAVTAAGQNIALNGLSHLVRHVEGDLLKGQQTIAADVIIVNIVADVVIALLPDLKPFLKENGVVITSGIIKDRCGDVLDAAREARYNVVETLSEGEWNCIVFRKG